MTEAAYDLVLTGGRVIDERNGIDGVNDVAIKGGLVPQCAMQVTRTRDGGEISLYTPPTPCSCYFERNVPGNTDIPAACTTCSTDNECGAGKCHLGVCEAR